MTSRSPRSFTFSSIHRIWTYISNHDRLDPSIGPTSIFKPSGQEGDHWWSLFPKYISLCPKVSASAGQATMAVMAAYRPPPPLQLGIICYKA